MSRSLVSVVVPADMTLPDAHELASRLEDEIREGEQLVTAQFGQRGEGGGIHA